MFLNTFFKSLHFILTISKSLIYVNNISSWFLLLIWPHTNEQLLSFCDGFVKISRENAFNKTTIEYFPYTIKKGQPAIISHKTFFRMLIPVSHECWVTRTCLNKSEHIIAVMFLFEWKRSMCLFVAICIHYYYRQKKQAERDVAWESRNTKHDVNLLQKLTKWMLKIFDEHIIRKSESVLHEH